MSKRVKSILFYLLSVILALILLYFFIKDANLKVVSNKLKEAKSLFIFYAVLGEIFFVILRTIRLKIILNPVEGNLSFLNLLKANVISFAVSGVSPGKLGEILRPVLISRWGGIPFTTSLASVILERGLDLFAIVLFWFLFLFSGAKSVSIESSLYMAILTKISIIIFLFTVSAISLIFLFVKKRELIELFMEKIKRKLKSSIINKIIDNFFIFANGVSSFKRKRVIALLLFISVILWFIIACVCFFTIEAVDIEVPFISSCLMMVLVSIGASIPTPGGIGGVHKAIQISLAVFYGIDENLAVSTAILGHALMFLPAIVWGILYLITGRVRFEEVKRIPRN